MKILSASNSVVWFPPMFLLVASIGLPSAWAQESTPDKKAEQEKEAQKNESAEEAPSEGASEGEAEGAGEGKEGTADAPKSDSEDGNASLDSSDESTESPDDAADTESSTSPSQDNGSAETDGPAKIPDSSVSEDDIDDNNGAPTDGQTDNAVTGLDEQGLEGSEELLMGASLEELLETPVEFWSATKTAETVETAPSIVEVVTAKDMQMWGHHTLADVLQNMLGFYVVDDHVLPNAGVRGVSGGRGAESGIIKVMINGRPSAFRATAGNWLGAELIPFSAIDRIEVIRGPASALYGADAFMATVNVILKKPEDYNGVAIHGVLESQTNSFDDIDSFWGVDNRYDISGGVKLGDFGILLSVAGENTQRKGLNLPASSPAPLVPDYNTGNDSLNGLIYDSNVFYGALSYERPRGSLTLSAYSSSIDRGGDLSHWTQQSYGTDHLGRHNETRVNLHHGIIGLDGVLDATDKVSLSLNLSYFMGRPLEDDRIEVASDLYYVKRDFVYRGLNSVAEVQWKLLDTLTLVGGFDFLFDHEQLPDHMRIDKSTGEALDGTSGDSAKLFEDLINPGVYLQAHWTAVPDLLKLTGGFRYDYHNVYGNQFTGRAGAVFLWTEKFSTKLLYGSAFKAPSPQLLYANPIMPGDIIGNEDLSPQYLHTFELAPAVKVSKYLTLHSTVAYSLIVDKAEFVPQGINLSAENMAKVHSLSWETGVKTAFRDILSGYVTFELNRTIRESGQEGYRADLVGQKNTIYPPWILRGGVSSSLPFLLPVPVRVGTQIMVVAKRRATEENIVENGGSYNLPAYAMWGASLSVPELNIFPTGTTTFSFRAYNLLDVRGPDPGFSGVDYPLLSRRLLLEVIQTF